MSTVLTGGEGKHLFPLTEDRVKPAMPLGGSCRLIDFVLSNLVNTSFLKICVLTQYKPHSLGHHISQTWQLSDITDQYVTPVPAQQRLGKRWSTGSADATLQLLNLVYDEDPEYVIVFDADHVYHVDPQQVLEVHIESGADVTVAGIRIPRSKASAFGVISADDNNRITEFLEKLVDPPSTPDDPSSTSASMGNYIFTTPALIDAIKRDSGDENSNYDVSRNIIPMLVEEGEAFVWDFKDSYVPGEAEHGKGYWRNVGTADTFYEANMDLVSVHPVFNLYDKRWPIYTFSEENLPPAKFIQDGIAQTSVVDTDSIVSDGTVRNSVINTNVVVEGGATVEGSVLFPGVRVGRGAVVRHTILDKSVIVPNGTIISVDPEKDAARFEVNADDVVTVGKGQVIQAD